MLSEHCFLFKPLLWCFIGRSFNDFNERASPIQSSFRSSGRVFEMPPLAQEIGGCPAWYSNGRRSATILTRKVAAIPLRGARNVLPAFQLTIALVDSKPLAGD